MEEQLELNEIEEQQRKEHERLAQSTAIDQKSPANIVSNSRFRPTEQEFAIRAGFQVAQPILQYDKWLVKTGADTFKYAKSSLNPVAQTAENVVFSAVFAAPHSVLSQNDKRDYEKLDTDVITLVNRQINELNYASWDDTLKQLLYAGRTFGFAVAELNFVADNTLWIIRDIMTKPSYNFDVYINNYDRVESLRYRYGLDPYYIDPRKYVLAPWPRLAEGNYYGISKYHSILQDIETLEILEEARAEATLQTLTRPIIHKAAASSRSTQDTTDARNAVANFNGSKGVIQLVASVDDEGKFTSMDDINVMPSRTEPEAIRDMKDIIDTYSKRIMRHLGVPDDIGMANIKHGTRAQAETEIGILNAEVITCRRWLENIVNRIILPNMLKWNYRNLPKDYCLPKWQFHYDEEEELKKKAEGFASLLQSGILDPSNVNHMKYIHESLKMPFNISEVNPEAQAPSPQQGGENASSKETNPQVPASR